MDTPIGPQNIEWPVIKAQETTGKVILHRCCWGFRFNFIISFVRRSTVEVAMVLPLIKVSQHQMTFPPSLRVLIKFETTRP